MECVGEVKENEFVLSATDPAVKDHFRCIHSMIDGATAHQAAIHVGSAKVRSMIGVEGVICGAMVGDIYIL